MRSYDTIKAFVKSLRNKSSLINESDLYDTYSLIDESDLYDTYSLIDETFTEYENAYLEEDKSSLLELLDSYIDKYEEIEEIYSRLEDAATRVPFDYSSLINFDEDVPDKDDRSLIEEVLERVHMDSGLRQHDNEVHNILRETLGWYFNEVDSVSMLRSFLLKNAEDNILDEFAYQYGLRREVDEDDNSLRYRIIAHMKELYRVRDVRESGVELFSYVDNPYTQMTSKNTYLSRKYLAHGTDYMMDYWDSRYITWRDISWF